MEVGWYRPKSGIPTVIRGDFFFLNEERHMKFKKGTRRRALEYEKDLINYWKKHQTFEKSVAMRPQDNAYVFYDGPPFITGVPHHGTLLSSIVKDAVPRYQTMKGKRVERVWGWDCHGLPAENFVEKKLGITDRHDIGTKISLEEYITTARESMVQTSSLWEDTIERSGRWVDFKGAYKTMDKDYMESVWWAFKQLYEKGKIYEGERVLMYDTKWATPLSKAEVTMDAGAYQVVTDPSVYTKFELADLNSGQFSGGAPLYFLAWTTTPWTLPGNTALAVHPEVEYAEVATGGERFIMAKDLVEKVITDEKHQPLPYDILQTFKGSRLVGLSYKPLFEDRGENAHKVWAADYVTTDSGTGIVHLAPAYGEEDFELAKQEGIPVVHVLDEYGNYLEGDWKGLNVWETNKTIAKTLKERGVVWKIDYIQHEYPHNLRNGNRLMYRAHPSWFMNIDGQRTEMLEQNTKNINWFPEHIKHGRFENTVKQAPDWNLSRDRFWATAMPVWKGSDAEGKEHVKVVGSYAELKQLSGVELSDYHRPWVDDIEFDLDGVHYKRIDKVLDCWFESGSMPFAQFHYPFENVEKFEQNFPGDFIVEYVSQVRAWFYYVHAVNVGLFGKNAFKNVIVTGTLAGNDGRKMSKSLGNFTDPTELMDKYSADSWRLLLLSSPVLNGEDFSLIDKDVSDTARKLSMIWNMYDFFTMYAEVDGWEFTGDLQDPSQELHNSLDQWIVSRVHQLNEEIQKHMDVYDIPSAVKPILPFIEDASNWYVRRSRRRFWKSGDDADKRDAYRTLHYILVHLAQVIAPFTPFLAEELYQKLTGGESVHLLDWPAVGYVNQQVVNEMAEVRDLINRGLSIRVQEGIKVRQALAKAVISGDVDSLQRYKDIFEEELNVKEAHFTRVNELKTPETPQSFAPFTISLDTRITPELKREGMMREVIRYVQNARKQIGLNVDDHIHLSLSSTDEDLRQAIEEHQAIIAAETLAEGLVLDQTFAHEVSCTVEDAPLTISLEKA
jgi:isoleucyl-tRNA synthetase